MAVLKIKKNHISNVDRYITNQNLTDYMKIRCIPNVPKPKYNSIIRVVDAQKRIRHTYRMYANIRTSVWLFVTTESIRNV